MKLLLVLALLSGCAHQHCLTKPPPDPQKGAEVCLAIPKDDWGARLNCGLGMINDYVRESKTWQADAWKHCGP